MATVFITFEIRIIGIVFLSSFVRAVMEFRVEIQDRIRSAMTEFFDSVA